MEESLYLQVWIKEIVVLVLKMIYLIKHQNKGLFSEEG